MSKGNRTCGSERAHARLTEGDVLAMRRLRAQGWPLNRISRAFPRVTTMTVWNVTHDKTWKHLPSWTAFRSAPTKITQPTGGDTLSVPAADCMGTLSHTLHAVGIHSRSQSRDAALGGYSNRNNFIPHDGPIAEERQQDHA